MMNSANSWKILIAFGVGFVVAQVAKVIILMMAGKKPREAVKGILNSGGMPSGHAASMTAATVVTGGVQGFDSAIFMLAVCVLAIVLYDAMNVRYATGVNAKILQKLTKEKVVISEGHTPAQIIVGVVLGVVIGVIMILA